MVTVNRARQIKVTLILNVPCKFDVLLKSELIKSFQPNLSAFIDRRVSEISMKMGFDHSMPESVNKSK